MRVFRFELLVFDVYNISKVGLAGVEEDIYHLAGASEIMIEKFLTSLCSAAKILTLLPNNFLNEVDLLIILILVL